MHKQRKINKISITIFKRRENKSKKPVSNLKLKMTLAPVIGGSERQGFGKYSLCSETKKEQIERPSRRIRHQHERKNTTTNQH